MCGKSGRSSCPSAKRFSYVRGLNRSRIPYFNAELYEIVAVMTLLVEPSRVP